MPVSAAYTLEDHVARESDRYAQAKYEITRRWLAEYARPGMTLINAGCGSGYFNKVAAAMGLSVIACEPDPEAFELARAAAPASCTVYNCDLAVLEERGARADFVVIHDVLEHIADDARAVDLLHSVVNPGGHAIVSVPAMPALFGRHDEQLGHFRRYTAKSLSRLLANRFDVCRLRYFGALSIPIVLLFSKILRRDYPRNRGGNGFIDRVYGAICDFEVTAIFPIGTSLLADVEPR